MKKKTSLQVNEDALSVANKILADLRKSDNVLAHEKVVEVIQTEENKEKEVSVKRKLEKIIIPQIAKKKREKVSVQIKVTTVTGILALLDCQCADGNQCLKCFLNYRQSSAEKFRDCFKLPRFKFAISSSRENIVTVYAYYYLMYHDWNSLATVLMIMLHNVINKTRSVWKTCWLLMVNHPKCDNGKLFDFVMTFRKLAGSPKLMLYYDSLTYFISVGEFGFANHILNLAMLSKIGKVTGFQANRQAELQMFTAYQALMSYGELCEKRHSITTDIKEIHCLAENVTMKLLDYFETCKTSKNDFPYLKQLLESMFIIGGTQQTMKFIRDELLTETYSKTSSTWLCLVEFVKKNVPFENNFLVTCLRHLVALIPSDDHVVELCTYLCAYEDDKSLHGAAEHLMEYLDYPVNSNHIEAWMLLTKIISQIRNSGTFMGLWHNRECWWPSFHFTTIPQLPDDSSAKLLALKAFVCYYLLDESNCFVYNVCQALKESLFPNYYIKLLNLMSEKGARS